MTICAVWLLLRTAFLLFDFDPSGEARRAALPTRCECYFYDVHTLVSGKGHL